MKMSVRHAGYCLVCVTAGMLTPWGWLVYLGGAYALSAGLGYVLGR